MSRAGKLITVQVHLLKKFKDMAYRLSVKNTGVGDVQEFRKKCNKVICSLGVEQYNMIAVAVSHS